MLHNQMEMLNCLLYDVREENTLDSFKICWTSKPPTVFATLLERPPFLLNSTKANRACRPAALKPPIPAPGQHAATGNCPPNSCCLFFLKALFLRRQKTQPQKSIRAIKKRHKLASSDGSGIPKPVPTGSLVCVCPAWPWHACPPVPPPPTPPLSQTPHCAPLWLPDAAGAQENVPSNKKRSYRMR